MAPSEVSVQASPWIISRGQDLLWFWGGAAISLAAGALAFAFPVLALPLFAAWLLFVDGPHFWGTWTRSIWDPGERARKGRLLVASFLIWLPGFAAFALDRAGWSAPWVAFAALTALWGWHHFVRQSYGIWALYCRRGGVTEAERGLDSHYLYLSLWGTFFWFAVAHPLNREEIGMTVPEWLPWVFGGSVILATVTYVGVLIQRARVGRPLLPGLFILGPNVIFQGLGFAWIGLAEPLIPGWTNVEQAFAVLALANGTTHGLQYLGLVAFAGRNRYPEGGSSLAARLSARPLRGWAILAALSVPYLAINLLRNAAPGVNLGDEVVAGLAFCVYAGFLNHHYLLDQFIWRPHSDAQLRADLRLA